VTTCSRAPRLSGLIQLREIPLRIYKLQQFQIVIIDANSGGRPTRRTASMNGVAVMIVTILTGIVLSAVYLVAEYRRWIKHETARDNRSASFRVSLSNRR
jgi:hypothetical protein